MSQLPAMLKSGDRARLFPVLADTSKEGRTLSIFLSCLQNVPDFGRALFASIDVGLTMRSKVECFTEVCLQKSGASDKLRPDGLLLITTSAKTWSALVEAKVGNAELTTDQIESYVELAKLNGIDAVITLSNQYAPVPSHHPLTIPSAARKKIGLFHWSWMFVITEAALLLGNEEIVDREQRVILQEMNRFLLHPSSGVKGFDQMPAAWSDLVAKVQAGGTIASGTADAKDVIGAWHQAVRHITYSLSRQLSADVRIRMSRAHAADPALRQKEALQALAATNELSTTLLVPDAASDIKLVADLTKRCVTLSMRLQAPADIKSTKARTNWLLRQLARSDAKHIHVRLLWPGKTAATQHPLEQLRANPELASHERDAQVVLSFEVLMVRDLGARFGQRRNFVGDVEAALPDFYEQVGQHLKSWAPRAPKLPAEKSEPADVGVEALRDEYDAAA